MSFKKIFLQIKKYISRRALLMRIFSLLKGWKTIAYYSACINKYNDYSIYNPEIKNPSKKKIIIALHGRNGTVYEFVPTLLSSFARKENFLIVCPGSSGIEFYSSCGEKIVLELIEEIKNKFNIDEEKIFILGDSAGGRGASYIGFKNSSIFAGIICIYGTITGDDLIRLTRESKKIPVFVAHGSEDNIIPISESESLAERLDELSFHYQFKVIEGLGHNLDVLDLSLPEIFSFFKKFYNQNTQNRSVRFGI
jgi:predicted peptidase